MFKLSRPSLVSGSCYKMLENPEVMKNKFTKDNLVHVLAILVKRYNHGLSESTFNKIAFIILRLWEIGGMNYFVHFKRVSLV